MAAKRKRTTQTQLARAVPVYEAPRQAAPIIRISPPRAITPAKTRKGKSRRRSSSGGGSMSTGKTIIGVAVGGAVIGFAEKSFGSSLPEVPLVGRKGALTAIAYMLAKQGIGGAIMRDAAIAGAAICGYELGKDGKISGDY